MMFPHHLTVNPFGPHAQQPAPDVPLHVFQAAQAVNATHLSADGLIAYDQRQYSVWYCEWKDQTRRFGSWYKIVDGGLPVDAVVMK